MNSPSLGPVQDGGLEQLAHDAERERLLELRALALERGEARALRRQPRLARELRLAGAGRALDEDQRALAAARAREGRPERVLLELAFEQGRFPRAWHAPTLSARAAPG